jgi:hypothetical protein
MFPEESFRKIFQTILVDHNFKFPIHYVMIGINGAFLNGRFELAPAKKFSSILLNGKAKNLRFPINTMFVDSKGDAAHVLFKKTLKSGELNHLEVPIKEEGGKLVMQLRRRDNAMTKGGENR